MDRANPELITLIKNGAIGVLRTDTLYGMVALATDKTAVQRALAVRGRDEGKACIVLIADPAELFDAPDEALREFIESKWPGPVSIAIPSPSAPRHLQFHDGTVAYRLPDDPQLLALLRETGPLIAPSANPPGEKPAKDVTEAQEYFGNEVDFYVDSGVVNTITPSQLWVYSHGDMERIR